MRWYLIVVLMLTLMLSDVTAQDSIIVVDARQTIVVGELWKVIIRVEGDIESLDAVLLSGLQQHHTTLSVDASGQAIWIFDENQLTTAGTALLLIEVNSQILTHRLEIVPQEPTTLDLFATGNAIEAYGIGQTQLISFIYDAYGNAIHQQVVTFSIQSPSGQQTQRNTIASQYGRINATVNSLGNPGIMQVDTHLDSLSKSLHIVQFPSPPNHITLKINPSCMLLGRAESLHVEARVLDKHDYPVRDGTQIVFRWDDGIAYGVTIGGIATISLPPFASIGEYEISAQVGSASAEASFQLVEDVCP